MQRVTFKASRAGRSMQRRYLCGQMGRRGGQQGCRTFATDWPGQCIFWESESDFSKSESSPFLSPSWSGVYCFTNNKDRSANKLMQGIFGNSEMQILKDLTNTYSTLFAGMETWFCAFSTQLPNGVETRTTGTKGRLAKNRIWEVILGSMYVLELISQKDFHGCEIMCEKN